ncbi:hypothetical protein FACS1894170_04550 [Planctomycetales bacterium]|nr:hypothetical protein FACS1894170_04550 [Planctomycetales bacterium]
MPAITPASETNALILEKVQSLLDDLDTVGDKAPEGHVLNDMDDFLFLHGRKLLTEILQSKIQERINATEQTDEAMQLQEFGCLHISRQAVSNLVPSLSGAVSGKLHNNAAIRKAFQEAEGDTEFGTDGAYINTRDAVGKH